MTLKINRNQWKCICNELNKSYGPSIYISYVMRRKLGFIRRHGDYDTVYLDFFNESKKTWFLLKYSDIINNKQSH